MKKILYLFFLFFCLSNLAPSQNKFIIQNKKGLDKISFKLINNLMIIPVEVNGVELSFILDTGVSKPIIFNFLNVSDTLKIKNTETIYIRGLGAGEAVEALKSRNNIFKIGDAIKLNQDLFAVYGLDLNFGPRLGAPIHGIIGLDVFRDFVVKINYSSSFIELIEPKIFKYKKCKNCERLNLEFYNDKPYVNAEVSLNDKKIPVKLLIDSGGSDSLWLFEDDSLGITSGNKFFRDFLGHGLSGSVYGKRGKAESFSLKSFQLNKPNVAYPDSTSIIFAKKVRGRNGSMSGNILKRFNIIMDYRNSLMTLRKNRNFKQKFSYNKSGIELAHNGVRFVKEYETLRRGFDDNNQNANQRGVTFLLDRRSKMVLKPAYAIVELREGSPAEKAGLMKGDVVLSINGKSTHQFSLQQIMLMFYDYAGRYIKLKVERDAQVLTYSFKLESLL
ncbi:PDZ domain-containing protein [Seonamhaeicola maritimus]|uniref:PDZ domain-containing protein n=2 Tax=Seonamhaeicola maritimus TaxID=2591822 RepID=A0A5C7GF92_9FLAO|nr:PDZ domain-containing protein [Seonamhaeicola maritimus]